MATVVVMPRQGNSVESCIIAGWKKKVGDPITEGEVLCDIETDKATMEVESPASGTLLALFFEVGDDVPVLTNIAAIGEPGENVDEFSPNGADSAEAQSAALSPPAKTAAPPAATPQPEARPPALETGSLVRISPRAKKLATRREVAVEQLQGSGPSGRIIERDVQAAIEAQPAMTPLARTMLKRGDFAAPPQGSGISGRIMSGDLAAVAGQPAMPGRPAAIEDEVVVTPVKGIRKVIATRMLESLQTTAQLTLNVSADARALQAYRKQLKNSAEALGLQKVTINDLILLAVSRTLLQFPDLNAHFTGDEIHQYQNVHLGMAVDTPRGLMVPVIRGANTLSLKQISQESKRLASACLEGKIAPDELSGGTFTLTNLGALGIESFTPVLNPPEVGILGVGNINLKPVQVDGDVQFIPHIGLSLTINHQGVDGAPAARFLQALSTGLARIELLLAL